MVIWFLVSFLKKVNEVIWISWLCLSFFISCSSLFLYICSFGILYLLLCSLRQKKSREESFGGSETRSLLRNVEWSGKNMLIPWDRWASLGSLIINLVTFWGNDYNESKFELQEDKQFSSSLWEQLSQFHDFCMKSLYLIYSFGQKAFERNNDCKS